MTNEDDGSHSRGEPQISTSAVSEAKPPDAVPSKPATEADLQEVERKMSGFERSTLRWTRSSFFIVLATAIFIALQWIEMRSGGSDTHDLAVAAGKQADRMKDFADRMKDQVDRTKDLADRMKDQADRTKTIADQAVIQANAAKSAANTASGSLSAYRDALSAQVVFENFNPDDAPDNPKPGTFQIVNRGNSIARNVYVFYGRKDGRDWITGKGGFTTDKWDELWRDISADEKSCSSQKGLGMVADFQLGIGEHHSEGAIDHPEDPEVLHGTAGEAGWAIVCYTDIFNRVESSHACVWWNVRARGTFSQCRVRYK